MRSYPALRIIAAITKVVTVLATAACVGVVVMLPAGSPDWLYVSLAAGTAYLALAGWASAELLLVLACGGEDLSAMLAQTRAGSEMSAKHLELMDRIVKLSELVPIHAPSPLAPTAVAPAPTEDAPRSEPEPAGEVAPYSVRAPKSEKLRDRHLAEGKCTECGTPLNFARVSIEKKTACNACETTGA